MAPVLSLDMGRDPFKAFLTDVVGISSDVVGDFCIKQVQCSAKSTGSLWKDLCALWKQDATSEHMISLRSTLVMLKKPSAPPEPAPNQFSQ